MAEAQENDPLQTVIDVQNEIVDAGLDFPEVLDLICERARALSGADCATIELVENGERIAAAVCGRPPLAPLRSPGSRSATPTPSPAW